MSFTAHNIRLSDGTQTRPNDPWPLEEGEVFRAARRMLNLVFPEGLTGKSIADLGCLEGGYTTGFARLGMAATGFEARESNLENCRYVKDRVKLDNLNFIKADVNTIDQYGPFDAIWAAGIFYHVESPRSLMQKMARVCGKILMVETHFTYEQRTPGADNHRLSELCEHEGLMGRWYHEFDGSVSIEEIENSKWSSWLNGRSFWLQKEYLLDLMHREGFDIVLEQYDGMPDILAGMKNYYHLLDRGMFIGIRI
jgi:SAM-dependent methyltransferase